MCILLSPFLSTFFSIHLGEASSSHSLQKGKTDINFSSEMSKKFIVQIMVIPDKAAMLTGEHDAKSNSE